MKKSIREAEQQSRATYEVLEEMIRLRIQGYILDMLEEEIETFLGRKKSERIKPVDGTSGYWNEHGKAKKFALLNGTISVHRTRVRCPDH